LRNEREGSTMAEASLKERVARLEAELAELKAALPGNTQKRDWIDVIAGSFAHDPMYEEAMRLGREWRESFRPKSKRRKRKR
jgi:hypothetical protein